MDQDGGLHQRRDALAALAESKGVPTPRSDDIAPHSTAIQIAFLATALGYDVRHALDVDMDLSTVERLAAEAKAIRDLSRDQTEKALLAQRPPPGAEGQTS